MKQIENREFLFNEDGSFKPILSKNGNIDESVSELRNIYLESERNYFISLLSDEDMFNYFISLINLESDVLAEMAIDLQTKLENGEIETQEDLEKMKNMSLEERDNYHMELLGKAEGMIALLLGAVKDKTLIKGLIYSEENVKRK